MSYFILTTACSISLDPGEGQSEYFPAISCDSAGTLDAQQTFLPIPPEHACVWPEIWSGTQMPASKVPCSNPQTSLPPFYILISHSFSIDIKTWSFQFLFPASPFKICCPKHHVYEVLKAHILGKTSNKITILFFPTANHIPQRYPLLFILAWLLPMLLHISK